MSGIVCLWKKILTRIFESKQSAPPTMTSPSPEIDDNGGYDEDSDELVLKFREETRSARRETSRIRRDLTPYYRPPTRRRGS